MRFWPFARRETRADSSYTDALVAAITANAGGKSAPPGGFPCRVGWFGVSDCAWTCHVVPNGR